ncbi:MAG: alpha/beta fold hydrolase [Ignavibacteriaceae bacterium]
MKIIKLYLLIFIITAVNIQAQSEQSFASIGDLELENGDIISDCKIGYRTFGKANQDTSNVIMYCSWFEGTSEAIGTLIEKRNFVDTSRYFIIAFDALGNGISSAPSNYPDSFPVITIRDMVKSQFIVLSEHLGIKHLHGAVGGSMGSMQVLEWAVAYPDFISKVVAYVCSPKLNSYDLLWMNTQLKMIETLKKYGAEEKEIKNLSKMLTAWISRTPEYINENININEFQSYLKSFEPEMTNPFTLDDYVSQMKAMISHDISRNYNYSMEKTSENIKAKLLIIVSKNDLMVNPVESIRLAELTGAELIILDNDCGHLAVSCEFEKIKNEIDLFLSH